MSNSVRNSTKHVKLFIPGPVEVREKILDAQANWMIGHRMPECDQLYSRINPKLQQLFLTKHRVFAISGTGTGFWEGASRNTVAKKVLHVVNGSFSEKWAQVSEANGKAVEVIHSEWGTPVPLEPVIDRLATGEFDAFAIVHNETSTGLTHPIKEFAQAIRALPNGNDILILVDSVSGLSGIEMRMDEWDLDVVLTSSQKAIALPPGLAIAGVSERAMQKAKTIKHRGYVYDFIELAKFWDKNQSPSTSPIPLLYALDVQLDDMLAEGIENRWTRHLAMRDRTIQYITSRGFELFTPLANASATLTTGRNNLNIDIKALNKHLRERGMIISNGYGKLKDVTFRIAHMGDLQMSELETLFEAMDQFLG